MNPYEENPPEDCPAPLRRQATGSERITIFAGPGTHFVLGALIFAFTFYFFGNVNDPTPQIGSAKVETTIDGEAVPGVRGRAAGRATSSSRWAARSNPRASSSTTIFTAQAEDRPGEPIDVTVDRNGDVIVVPVAPVMTDDEEGDPTGRIGVELQVVTTRMGPLTAIKEGVTRGRPHDRGVHPPDRAGVQPGRDLTHRSACCSTTQAARPHA